MIENCTWLGNPECKKYLSYIPTDEGICITFNYGANYSDPLLDFSVMYDIHQKYLLSQINWNIFEGSNKDLYALEAMGSDLGSQSH